MSERDWLLLERRAWRLARCGYDGSFVEKEEAQLTYEGDEADC